VSKRLKLIQRFKNKPTDFTWHELEQLLANYGFEILQAGKTSGSRTKFIHTVHPVIFLHRPHPSQILKRYQMEYIYDYLFNEALL
jgi:hypothetical protein